MSKKDDLFLFTNIPDAPSKYPTTETADKPPVIVDELASDQTQIIPQDDPDPMMEEPSPVEEIAADTAPADDAVDVQNVAEEAPVEATAPEAVSPMEDAFRTPSHDKAVQVIAPSFMGTADALTAAPKAKPAPVEEPAPAPASASVPAPSPAPAPAVATFPKKNFLMRILDGIVPLFSDTPFDFIRKCVLVFGIVAFVTAAVAFVQISVIQPIQYEQQTESLRSQYTPGVEQELTSEEENYNYPHGIDPDFKKLYYQNNDIRGWITYKTTDNTSFSIDYPIVQSADNDYYLFHDFNRVYNKNGVLFFDYRNDLSSSASTNRNTIIYGHNMASGQMFAGLNKLLYSVDYARVAPTFTMNSIFEKAEYKVFAVLLVNNTSTDGIPFGYLRTEFADNIEFASFLSEIKARSLYDYNDVDVRPDDEIISLSTCTDVDLAHFKDGRTVVVARKVREGENPATDVSKIAYNADVIMPYGWYVNQKLEPHPYYVNLGYAIQPLDTLVDYLSTSTTPDGQPTTTPSTMYTDPNGSTTTTTVPTNPNGLPIVGPTGKQIVGLAVESTPINYYMGSGFDYARTKVNALVSDGTTLPLDSRLCAVTGFDSSKPGVCKVTLHYGTVNVSFSVNIFDPYQPIGTTTTTAKKTTQNTTQTVPQTTTVGSTTVTTSRSQDPNVLFTSVIRTTTTLPTTTVTTTTTTDVTDTEVTGVIEEVTL